MVKAKKFVYATPYVGLPKLENFRLETEDLPEIKDGEFLCEAEYLSIDPYMRPYMNGRPVGTTMIGGQVAKIIATKNDKYPAGSYVVGYFGWRTHTICNPKIVSADLDENTVYLIPPIGNLSRSLCLGYLGMPGNTSYFGLLEICKPKQGETVVVTTAAGAVGSLVGQIAKIKGCKVIGYTGSDEKCDWLKKELGFDHVFNYKNVDIAESLKKAAPNGVDCYFDNVGGEISSTIIHHMNQYGRISVCGSISAYNATGYPKATIIQPDMIFKELKMEGFIVRRWANRFPEGLAAIGKWIAEGKVKYRESITEGFENMPKAFISLFDGDNIGKAVIKV